LALCFFYFFLLRFFLDKKSKAFLKNCLDVNPVFLQKFGIKIVLLFLYVHKKNTVIKREINSQSNIHRLAVYTCTLLFFTLSLFSQTSHTIAQSKINALNNLILAVEELGIDATKEKMTVHTAELFLSFANWDETNDSINTVIFSGTLPLPTQISNSYTPSSLAQFLPEFERQEVIILLDNALAELSGLLAGNALRKPYIEIDWTSIDITGNKLVQNGKPVFLQDYIWKPSDTLFTQYYGNQSNSLTNSAAGLNFGAPFLGQTSVPGYISSQYPEILDLDNRYTKFDIDHPQARQLHIDLFQEVVPILKGSNTSKLGYMLTNEPHWNTAAGSWDVITPSDTTKNKFADWLAQKYNNTIGDLQLLWSTNPSSFQQAAQNFIFPVPYSYQGTAEWYDWMKFNQERVTEWFTFLKDEIQNHDSLAKTHIKVMPWQWVGNTRDHGIDFEALAQISSVVGNDAGAYNSYLWGGSQSWEAKYNFYWKEVAMMYDFFASVNPNAIIYNSEGHFTNKGSSANIFMQPSYIKMAYWLAYLQGMDITKDWVWTRDPDGSVPSNRKNSHSGTVTQQPQVLHEITSTVMDINRFAKEVDAFQNERKAIRIFYSETSAINTVDLNNSNINSNRANYMNPIHELYEAMYFDGLSIGFATEDIINQQNHSNWDALVITNTKYVTTNELQALQSYIDGGGTVFMDAISLSYDEYGRQHIDSLNGANLTLVSAQNSTVLLKQEVDNFLAQNSITPVVSVLEINPLGNSIKGCLNRSVILDSGRTVAVLINIANQPINVTLSLNNSYSDFKVIDLLDNGKTLCKTITMQPEEVLLLELNEGESCNAQCIPLILHNAKEISGGQYHASDSIVSSARIPEGCKVDYYSNSILLENNFAANKGAGFTADIIDCYE